MSDYSALAQRVSSSVSGIRGCLLLSRDGLVLGADPEGEDESQLKAAWVRFASIGEPDRSYVEFPDQTWAYVRRGSYAAFAVADVGVRPGIVVDLLEQALLVGEQERAIGRETMRLPEALTAPSGRPRTSLHLPDRPAAPTPEQVQRQVAPGETEGASEEVAEPVAAPEEEPTDAAGRSPSEHPSEHAGEAVSQPEHDAPPELASPVASEEEESEVDRILLAKEFAGLLQVPKEDDEASR